MDTGQLFGAMETYKKGSSKTRPFNMEECKRENIKGGYLLDFDTGKLKLQTGGVIFMRVNTQKEK